MRILFDLVGAFDDSDGLADASRYAVLLAKAMSLCAGAHSLDVLCYSEDVERVEDAACGASPLRPAIAHFPASPLKLGISEEEADLKLAVKRRTAALAGPDALVARDIIDDVFAKECDAPAYSVKITAFLSCDKIPKTLSAQQRRRLAACDVVFTASQTAREKWMAAGENADKIVALSGAGDPFFHCVPPALLSEKFSHERIRPPFVLAMAQTPEDVNRLLAAWALLDRPVFAQHRIVIFTLGARAFEYDVSAFGDEQLLLFNGFSRDDLLYLYNCCSLFVFCTRENVFGLPILEAMQCGAAVLVADEPVFAEIVDRSEQRCDFSQAKTAAAAIQKFLEDENFLAAARAYGLERAKNFCWRKSGERAWATITAAQARQKQQILKRPLPASLKTRAGFEAQAARILKNAPHAEKLALAAAQTALASRPSLYDAARPRLFVDVTAIAAHDAKTGIQRVVRRLLEALYLLPKTSFLPMAARLDGDRFISAESLIARQTNTAHVTPDGPLSVSARDILLMLDNSWDQFPRFEPIFQNLRAAGGQSYAVIYDLIPILWRGASVGDVPKIYENWLRQAVLSCDGLIAISQTVAQELEDFLRARAWPHRPGLKIGWWRLGADFAGAQTQNPSPKIVEFFAAAQITGEPVFLAVGTIEPRKGHATALAAFERLWSQGFGGRLVFIGRKGWNMEILAAKMMRYQESEPRFSWFSDASDADLAHAYASCAAVLAPSYAEGYGLPLSEAAHYQKPVICSDIPVFREIGGEGAIYFRCNDDRALAQTIAAFAKGEILGDHQAVLRPIWEQSARDLLDGLENSTRWRILDEASEASS